MSATIKNEQGPWTASSVHLLARDGRQAVSTAGYDDEPAPQVLPDVLVPYGWQRLLFAVDDLRRLTMQNIFVGQSKASIADKMWSECCEARRSESEQLLRSQQLELELTRAKDELSAVRQRQNTEQASLERSIKARDESIADLQDQVIIFRSANRDLSSSTAKLTEAIWDLAGADDVEGERERLMVRYDELELRCAYLDRQLGSTIRDKCLVEEQLRQMRGQYAQFCADSNREIVERDEIIHALRSFVEERGLVFRGDEHSGAM